MLSYAISVLVVCALGLGAATVVFRKTLRANRRLLAWIVLVVAAPQAAIEAFALRWHLWAYTPGKVIPWHLLGAQPETYAFSVLVVFNFALLALGLAEWVDRKAARGSADEIAPSA